MSRSPTDSYDLIKLANQGVKGLQRTDPADHPLAGEFEEQFYALEREYKGDGEHLSMHHPDDDPSARDDAPDATALTVFAKDEGQIGWRKLQSEVRA